MYQATTKRKIGNGNVTPHLQPATQRSLIAPIGPLVELSKVSRSLKFCLSENHCHLNCPSPIDQNQVNIIISNYTLEYIPWETTKIIADFSTVVSTDTSTLKLI